MLRLPDVNWVLAAGPFVGYLAGIATEVIRGQFTVAHARSEREAARDERRREERVTFERETLAALDDAVSQFVRQVGATHQHMELEYRATGSYGRGQLPEHLGGEPSLHPLRQLKRLTSRVLDDELRRDLTLFAGAGIEATAGAMRDEADDAARDRGQAAIDRTLQLLVPIQEEIGRQLRSLYSA